MEGAIDVDWEEVYLDLESGSENAKEVPGLGYNNDNNVEDYFLLSNERLNPGSRLAD